MKYFVTNITRYIGGTEQAISIVKHMKDAIRFSGPEHAARFRNYNVESPNSWNIACAIPDLDGNYVISAGALYVSSSSKEKKTNTFKRARCFLDIDDAREYIKSVKPFPLCTIISETGETLDIIETKQSSPPAKITSRTKISKGIKRNIFEKSNRKCSLCGRELSYERMSVDHIVPLSRGGANDVSNLRATCLSCNAIKDSLTDRELFGTITTVLSHRFETHEDYELSDKLIRAIVRSRINNIFEGAYHV